MASAARQLTRAAPRAAARRTPGTTLLQQTSRRFYSSGAGSPPPPPPKSSGSGRWPWLAGIAAVSVGASTILYFQEKRRLPGRVTAAATAQLGDYQAVYDEIAGRLEEKDDYDDGSYGPVLLRLAWHCSGTYDRETRTGGSNGATMRFAPESGHGANAGLDAARTFLEPVKGKLCLLPTPPAQRKDRC